MKVDSAIELARRWAATSAGPLPGFVGATLHGSTVALDPDADLSATSDLDVLLIFADSAPPIAPGKRLVDGLLLDATALPADRIATADQVLADYHLAGSFRGSGLLLDPSGRLAELHARVGDRFAERRWVLARVDHAAAQAARHLEVASGAAAPHTRVTGCLFGAGVLTHLLLVAALRNPTVRRRYEDVGALLAESGRLDVHEDLLRLLGSADLTPARVDSHLPALERAFDAAAAVARTLFFFSSDITAAARPLAIAGSRASIAAGRHREAMFWIAATFARCRAILAADAPAELAGFDSSFAALRADLGIGTDANLERRVDEIHAALPHVRALAAEIAATHPAIQG